MKINMDLDMVAHELGHLRQEVGRDENDEPILELVPLEKVASIAKGRVWSIFVGAHGGGFNGFLTKGKHFRHKLATILPYKGHREDMARNNVDKLKDIFHRDLGAVWCTDWEADDAIASEQWADLFNVGSEHGWDDDTLRKLSNTVIASRDKDLDTVPGWHFKWWLTDAKDREGNPIPEDLRKVQKGEAYWVTIIEAFRNFYKQMLVGDTADNIKGLFNVGPKSAWIKQLDDMDDEEEMYDHVEDKYRKYYGNYADQFIMENGNLLHMQRYKGDQWLPPHARDDHYWYLP